VRSRTNVLDERKPALKEKSIRKKLWSHKRKQIEKVFIFLIIYIIEEYGKKRNAGCK